MTKSVFRRFLFFSLTVALICCVIICGILAFPVADQIRTYKRNTLESNAQNVADYMSAVSHNTSTENGPDNLVIETLDSMSKTMHAVIVVADKDGVISSVEALRILQYINGKVTTLEM